MAATTIDDHPEALHTPGLPTRIITLVAVALPPLGLVAVAGAWWGIAVTPIDLALLLVLYIVPGLGITIGFHRYFTHKSFETFAWMRAVLAILGAMTTQGPVSQWVSDHRKHHALLGRARATRTRRTRASGRVCSARLRGLGTRTSAGSSTTKGLDARAASAATSRRPPAARDRPHVLRSGSRSARIPYAFGYAIGGVSGGLHGHGLGRAGAHLPVPPRDLERQLDLPHVRPPAVRDARREPQQLARSRSRPSARHGTTTTTPSRPPPSTACDGRQLDLSGYLIHKMERIGLVWDVKRVDLAARLRRRVADETVS